MQKQAEELETLNKYRILSLDRLISNGVVYEEYQQFKNSVFADVYTNAVKLTEQIVLANREYAEQNRNRIQRGSSATFEFSNVISFVGRRGTGKTSAMYSFAEALRIYSGTGSRMSSRGLSFGDKLKDNDLEFYVLDCIDASDLEESEDIFALILANMFGNMQNMTKQGSSRLNDYDNRTLFEKFEKVYEDFITLNGNLKENDGYSAFEKLRNLSSSQRLRNNFEELVRLYLEQTVSEADNDFRKTKPEPYLVIMIDDLDMAKQVKGRGKWNWGCYKLMSSIYKYLTVSRVIVLTAYNDENLYNHCVDYFKEQYQEGSDGLWTLASQFVGKVFPIFTRLYMPSWNKRDLESERKIRIDVNSEADILLSCKDKRYLPVKEFSLALLGEKTGIYFDYEGKKRHFFVPETLRSLFNTTELLLEMESYDHSFSGENGAKEMEKFAYNVERMKEDLHFRFAYDTLTDPEDKKIFQRWQEQTIDRRAEAIVRDISGKVLPLGRRLREVHRELIRQAQLDRNTALSENRELLYNGNVPYSYAELVHCLYHMSRDTGIRSRKLVCCELYSFTIYLTEIYQKYRFYKKELGKTRYFQMNNIRIFDEDTEQGQEEGRELSKTLLEEYAEEIKSCYGILKEIIGLSACGKWGEYYFPAVTLEMQPNRDRDNTAQNTIIGYAENSRLPYKIAFSLGDSVDQIVWELKKLLFIASQQTDSLRWSENDVTVERNGEKFVFGLNETANGSDFDMTAFFKYSFCYMELIAKLEKLMIGCLKPLLEKGKTDDSVSVEDLPILGNLQKAFQKVAEEFYQWDTQYGSMMLPLYNLDVSYNLLKRVFQECTQRRMATVDLSGSERAVSSEIFNMYEKVTDRFLWHLGNIDDAYHLTGTNESFAYAFQKCPFMKWLNEIKEKEENESSWREWRVSQYIRRMAQKLYDEADDLTD